MGLGVGIFASVVLILAVYHKGFRKVLFWSGAVAVILALLGVGGYFVYDRYTTWQADRVPQKQKAAVDQGIRTCMSRLGAQNPRSQPQPMFSPDGSIREIPQEDLSAAVAAGGKIAVPFIDPRGGKGYIPIDRVHNAMAAGGHIDGNFPAAYYDDLAACVAYPDMGIPLPPAGFIPDSLPSGYMLDLSGKVAPIPPGASIQKNAAPIDLSAGLVPKKDTRRILKANVTCDVVVYDRDEYAGGDREAIDSLHAGDVVEYIGDSGIPGHDSVIRVHGRRGYVYVVGCIDVIP